MKVTVRKERMMRVVSSAFVTLLLALGLRAQTAPAAPELTRLLKEFLAGASRNDAAAHERFRADDLIYTGSSGRRVGKAEIMRGVRSAQAPRAWSADHHLLRRRHQHPAVRRRGCRRLPLNQHDREGWAGDGRELSEHRHLPQARRQVAGGELAGDRAAAPGGRGQAGSRRRRGRSPSGRAGLRR
jgi:hypothetical protein